MTDMSRPKPKRSMKFIPKREMERYELRRSTGGLVCILTKMPKEMIRRIS